MTRRQEIAAELREAIITVDTKVFRDELGYYFGRAVQELRALQPPAVTTGPCPPDLVPVLGLTAGVQVVIRDRVLGDHDRAGTAARHVLPPRGFGRRHRPRRTGRRPRRDLRPHGKISAGPPGMGRHHLSPRGHPR